MRALLNAKSDSVRLKTAVFILERRFPEDWAPISRVKYIDSTGARWFAMNPKNGRVVYDPQRFGYLTQPEIEAEINPRPLLRSEDIAGLSVEDIRRLLRALIAEGNDIRVV